MPGFGSWCLMCAIAMMLACTSATKAPSWRYYGYHWHWYGHTWSDPNRGNDERRGDESRAEDKSDLRNRVGDFGSAIERMIRSLGVLRPTFTTFYGLLGDEQKARLVAMGISNNASGKQDVAIKQNGSRQDSLC